MNGVGRQGQRSGVAGVHHQRQYFDKFLESSSNGRWLQSASLQHLQSSNAPRFIPPLQDYGFYGGLGGGGGQGSKMYRSGQRSFNEFYVEPSTPPQRKNIEDSPNEFSPRLLDLHFFNTELLSEVGWDESTAGDRPS